MVAQIFLIILTIQAATGLDNGLGLTPQMGWNSWNRFGCNINEALIKKTADQLVNTGLAEKGYVYVNLDDCWQVTVSSYRLLGIKQLNKSFKIKLSSPMVSNIQLIMFTPKDSNLDYIVMQDRRLAKVDQVVMVTKKLTLKPTPNGGKLYENTESTI